MEFGPVARTVPDLIREMAASAPDAKAIIPESGQPLSYSDLAKLVEAGASGLRASERASEPSRRGYCLFVLPVGSAVYCLPGKKDLGPQAEGPR